MLLVFILTAVIAGGLLPVQGLVNGQLGRALDNVVFATLISFFIGTLTLLIIFLFRSNWSFGNGLQGFRDIPPVLFIGGALGAAYVTAVAALVPKIGVANTMIALVLGQIILSLLLDHFGILGVEVREVGWSRILGAGLVVLGLVLVVKY